MKSVLVVVGGEIHNYPLPPQILVTGKFIRYTPSDSLCGQGERYWGRTPDYWRKEIREIHRSFIRRFNRYHVLKPVVKWAGGKRQILPHLSKYLPDPWNHYYEPFIGGGALLIHLYNQHLLSHATISDTNGELVNLYRVIQDTPEELVQALTNPIFRNTRKDYLELRQRFNRMKRYRSCSIEKAALFLYLNRHGYNGLWRVNRRGEFNVPFGRYRSPVFPSPDHIRAFSRMLIEVVIRKEDFASTTKKAQDGDFVYFDPPYQPVSGTANFTSYMAGGFGYDEQVRLAHICDTLRNRGVAVMVSNSFTPEILSLYRGFTIHRVTAHRAINSKPEARSGITELIITSYS